MENADKAARVADYVPRNHWSGSARRPPGRVLPGSCLQAESRHEALTLERMLTWGKYRWENLRGKRFSSNKAADWASAGAGGITWWRCGREAGGGDEEQVCDVARCFIVTSPSWDIIKDGWPVATSSLSTKMKPEYLEYKGGHFVPLTSFGAQIRAADTRKLRSGIEFLPAQLWAELSRQTWRSNPFL